MQGREAAKDGRQRNSRSGRSVNQRLEQCPSASNVVQGDDAVPRVIADDINVRTARSFESITDSSNYTFTSPHRGAQGSLSETQMSQSHNDRFQHDPSGVSNDESGESSLMLQRFTYAKLREGIASGMSSLDIASNLGANGQIRNRPTADVFQQSEGEAIHRGVSAGEDREDGVVLVGHTKTSSGRIQTKIWCFPGLSIRRMRELLERHELHAMLVNCPSGQDQNVTSWLAPGLTIGNSVSSYVNQGGPPSLSANGGGSDPRAEGSAASGDARTDTAALFFACPMVKHNGHHYANIHNPCTHPPGIKEFRRVKEHIQKYHSPKPGCPFCPTKWRNPSSFVDEFQRHIEECVKVGEKGLSNLPEALDQDQVEALEQDYRGWQGDRAWVDLYEKLFPASRIPSPYYDYYIRRYQLRGSSDNFYDVLTPRPPRLALSSTQPQQHGANAIHGYNHAQDPAGESRNQQNGGPGSFLGYVNNVLHVQARPPALQDQRLRNAQELDSLCIEQTSSTEDSSNRDSGFYSTRWSLGANHERRVSTESSQGNPGSEASFPANEAIGTQPWTMAPIEERDEPLIYSPGHGQTSEELFEELIREEYRRKSFGPNGNYDRRVWSDYSPR